MDNEKAKLELKAGAFLPMMRQDSGRGIVRIDMAAMHALGVSVGDVVSVEGKRATAAVVEGAYPSDVGLGTARMDWLTMHNAGAAVEEGVRLARADAREAVGAVLAPAQRPPRSGEEPARSLLGRPVVKGDLLVVTAACGREVGIPVVSPVLVSVAMTNPRGVVRITARTRVELRVGEG